MAHKDNSRFVRTISLVGVVRLFVFVAVQRLAFSFPTGAPSYSCRRITPGHNNGTQSSPPPYRVQVSKTVMGRGESTLVSVVSTGDFPFIGFICAASDLSDPNNNAVGTMTPSMGFQERDLIKPITCTRSDPDTAMTHTNRREKVKVEFEWTSPTDAAPGHGFKMRCTVVQSFFRCWTGIQVDITIDQSVRSPSTRNGNIDLTGNNGASGNNNVIIQSNNDFGIPPRHPSNLVPMNTDAARFSSHANTNQNQNPTQGSGTSSFQNQNSGFTAVDLSQRNSNDVRPLSNSNPTNWSLLPHSPNQQMDISTQLQTGNNAFFPSNQAAEILNILTQDPGSTGILLSSQDIPLAVFIELINMGLLNQLQSLNPMSSFNSNPGFNTNSNSVNQVRDFAPIDSQTRQMGFSNRNSNLNTFDTRGPVGFNSQITQTNNGMTPRRGPNSRGLFQTSNARPFNRSFNRIRQPRIQQGSLITNNV